MSTFRAIRYLLIAINVLMSLIWIQREYYPLSIIGFSTAAFLVIAWAISYKRGLHKTEDLTEEEWNGGFENLTDEQRKRVLNVGMEGVPSEGALWLMVFILFVIWLFVK